MTWAGFSAGLARLAVLLVVLGIIASGQTPLVPAATAATLPSGFTDELVAPVSSPTALAFTPDGRLLITSQSGRLHVFQDGELLDAPALDLTARVCSNSERGLLGVAVDPGFAANQQIYLYYTFRKHGDCPTGNSQELPVNRVSRFTLNADSTVDPMSETVLIDNIPSIQGNHNAGDLQFGADGYLYVSAGDAGVRSNAQAVDVLAGKILRIATDGSIPASNPFASVSGARRCGDPAGAPAGEGPCQEIFASGLRNPFRIAFRPGTSELYINDVGQSTWEEIDEGLAGANYGWPEREGPCRTGSRTDCPPPPAGVTDPIYAYDRTDGCATISGGAFVPDRIWPAEYQGRYLFADFICGRIFVLVPQSGGSYTATDFATGLGRGSVVHLAFGPHQTTQALYYATYASGSNGEVRRIAYTASFTPTSFVRLPVVLVGEPQP